MAQASGNIRNSGQCTSRKTKLQRSACNPISLPVTIIRVASSPDFCPTVTAAGLLLVGNVGTCRRCFVCMSCVAIAHCLLIAAGLSMLHDFCCCMQCMSECMSALVCLPLTPILATQIAMASSTLCVDSQGGSQLHVVSCACPVLATLLS